MPKQIFVNLPVKDLQKTIGFFTQLGFSFNPQFTDENAACLQIAENIYAMLLIEKFFQTFTKKKISDAKKNAEAIIALSVDSKDEVNELVKKAVAAGAQTPNPPQDHGWMYGHGFEDLDGHLWEVFYMDQSKMPPPQAK